MQKRPSSLRSTLTPRQITLRLIQVVLEYKWHLSAGVCSMVLYSALNVSIPIMIKQFIDRVVNLSDSGETPEIWTFFGVAAGVVILFCFRGLFYFLQNYLMNGLGQRLLARLREMLFTKILHLPFSFFNKSSTGDLISRFTNDLNVVEQAIYLAMTGPVRDLPQIIFLLGLLFYTSPALFLISISILPPYIFLIARFGKANKRVTFHRQEKFSRLLSNITESITGIRIVKSFSREKYEEEIFQGKNEQLYREYLKTIYINSYSVPIIEIMGSFWFSMLLGIGSYQIIVGEITTGDFVQFITAFYMLSEPIKKFNGFNLKLQEGMAASDRIFYILELKNFILENIKERPLKKIREGIDISINHFSYGEENILEDIRISVEAGKTLALVGTSGSGKTTLVNLLPRFFDLKKEEGHIAIDGVDIRDLNVHSLRNSIAIVTQDIVLFNDTVLNNIRYGKIEASFEEVQRAARLAHAEDFIENLPKGYEQVIGEKGVSLSGGQRQRLSIARAIIKNAPILILDEATSALDSESEQQVQAAINNLMQGRTTIVIAHRFSTIQHADIIHAFSNRRIVESGTHEELIQKGGEYFRLHQLQFKK